MKRLITRGFFPVLAAALMVSGGVVHAQQLAQGEYIVSSQIVSDTATGSSNYVGDIGSGCADGNCGGSDAGVVSSGDGTSVGGGCSGAGCIGRGYDHSDLFYNYYSQGNYNTANAQMYISPLPVPPFVGHTFNTYQPFYPHHYLYWHKDRYHNTYDNGRGMNRTKAVYYAPPIKTAVSNLYWNKLRIPR
ncbi:hypothetical protein [Stieleria varia]|uniref:Uncharacterized protein n=1 Tax=Stieleria varia TaxID=2528005 RepID=A0A5C6AP88_9BACT|nr:hypothetical protein [Stieleria varia]TWU00926.1 hypothetical protein Pla52n_42960 [Stieleria varia]